MPRCFQLYHRLLRILSGCQGPESVPRPSGCQGNTPFPNLRRLYCRCRVAGCGLPDALCMSGFHPGLLCWPIPEAEAEALGILKLMLLLLPMLPSLLLLQPRRLPLLLEMLLLLLLLLMLLLLLLLLLLLQPRYFCCCCCYCYC